MNNIKILMEQHKRIHSGAPSSQALRYKYLRKYFSKELNITPLYLDDYWSTYPDLRKLYGIFKRSIDFIIPDFSTLLTIGLFSYVNSSAFNIVHTMDFSLHTYNAPTIYERSAPLTYLLKKYYNLDYKKLRFSLKVEKFILKQNKAKIIAWTKWAYNLLLNLYDLYDNIEIIHPFLDIDYINSIKRNRTIKKEITIYLYAKDFYRKGGDLALDIFKVLMNEYKNLRLIIRSPDIPIN